MLEYIIPEKYIEHKFIYAFVTGSVYSIVGIFLARLIFASNSGIASVIFTSILLIPTMRKLFMHEQRVEEKERKFIWKNFLKDNRHPIMTYLGIFFGAYITYFLITLIGMKMGNNMLIVFPEQLAFDANIVGGAFSASTFFEILANNWWVLLAAFMLSMLSGNGAIFFVVWNASVWAVIFAARSFAASYMLGKSLFATSSSILAITFPHVLLEGLSYVLVGIAGAVISADIFKESKNMRTFIVSFIVSIFLFVLVHRILGFMVGYLPLFLEIIIVLLILYAFRLTFSKKKHKEVFIYNYWLFVIGILVFLAGAIIETYVLHSSGLLQEYYMATYHYFNL